MKRLFQTKVNRNGIRFDKIYYYHPALLQWIGQDVLFQTRKKPEYGNVYSMKGNFICKAKADFFMETPASKQKCLSCPYFPQLDKTYVGSDSQVSPEAAQARFSAFSKSS